MAFSRAKIHRFNEDTSCAPPPGSYDPKLDTKVKGVPKYTACKKFPDQLGSSQSLDNLERVPSDVTFRTPQVTRKILLTPRLKQLQDSKFDTPNSESNDSNKSEDYLVKSGQKREVTSADYQRLKEELSIFKKKHFSEISMRDAEVAQLKNALEQCHQQEVQLTMILDEKTCLATERNKELLEMQVNLTVFEEKIANERTAHSQFITELQAEILELKCKNEDLEGIIQEKLSAIVNMNEKCINLESKIKDLQLENQSLKEDTEILENINSEMLKTTVLKAMEKLEELEKNTVSNLHKILQDFEVVQQKIHVEYQTQVNHITHEITEKKEDMENKIKQCLQTFDEFKKKANEKLKEFSKDIEEANDNCKYLFRELCKVEVQRDELLTSDLEKKLQIINIQEQADCYRSDLEECKDKCKKYEISINTTQNTIAALSNRLLESEKEVERLSTVEIDLETQKQSLEEKAQKLLTDITALRSSMDRMEKEIICDVSTIKEDLEGKVEIFKAGVAKHTEVLNETIHQQRCDITMLLRENESFKLECKRKDESISNLTCRTREYKDEIDNLKNECLRIEEEITEKLSFKINENNILDSDLEKAVRKVKNLEQLNSDREYKIGVLNKENKELKSDLENIQTKVTSLESEKLEILNEIRLLKSEVDILKNTIERCRENENKQQNEIDGFISDLILEKERCSSLEGEINEKFNENNNLIVKITLLERSVKNAEERVTVIDEAKATIELQAVQMEKDHLVKVQELENKITDMQLQMNLAKERIRTELPNLQHDNVNKAERILELSMHIDSLKEKVSEYESKINCYEMEKLSLDLQLDECKKQIGELESAIEKKDMNIDSLIKQKTFANDGYKEAVAQNNKLLRHLNQLTQESKQNIENSIKADEKIAELQERLAEVEMESTKKSCLDENSYLKEELEDLRLKLQAVTEERDKSNKELADMLGHQNIHQKIKHVNQLKMFNAELIEKNNNLEIEVMRLKKKLTDSTKENAIVTPKSSRSKSKDMPSVLKERNN